MGSSKLLTIGSNHKRSSFWDLIQALSSLNQNLACTTTGQKAGLGSIILVYVDDYLVATDDEEYFGRFLESFKEFLKDGGQKVKHLGTPENLLQMKVDVMF